MLVQYVNASYSTEQTYTCDPHNVPPNVPESCMHNMRHDAVRTWSCQLKEDRRKWMSSSIPSTHCWRRVYSERRQKHVHKDKTGCSSSLSGEQSEDLRCNNGIPVLDKISTKCKKNIQPQEKWHCKNMATVEKRNKVLPSSHSPRAVGADAELPLTHTHTQCPVIITELLYN